MTKTRNPRDLLTPAALHILISLAEDDLHGYAIKHAVEERTGGRLSLGPGTLYEAIHRMAADDWIVELPAAGRRRVYQLTADGKRVLDEELKRLDEIVSYARDADLMPRTT
jgi:DNA-binding PadR family transcriptional regulator